MKLPKLLDCTLRDGGYINKWDFSRNFGAALYRAVSAAGVDYIEVGFLEPGAKHGLPWTNLSADDLRSIRENVQAGTAIAVMINYGSVALEDMLDAKDYPADLIRVAASKSAAEAATAFAAALTAKGYRSTINYMGISNYTNQEILGLVDLMNRYKSEVEYFYVADSFGSLLPARTREIFTTLRFGTDAQLGFHPHNNLQMAFANCLEAMEAGVDIIDGSVFGMGRGAGNLFTDAVVAYFETIDPERFKLMPILQFADLYMEEMKQQYAWGYSLPQLLSGILKCHPNYPTNLLKEKSYTADDIFSMLRHLPEDAKPRYSKEVTSQIKQQHFKALAEESEVLVCEELKELCSTTGGKALLVCGGSSVVGESDLIRAFIEKEKPSVFSVNNPNPPVEIDGVFFGNRRRILRNGDHIDRDKHVILGSEIHAGVPVGLGLKNVSKINALRVLPDGESPFLTYLPSNSAMEAILGLVQCGYRDISICGLDGYRSGQNYYYAEDDQLAGETEWARENAIIQNELNIISNLKNQIGLNLKIITKSLFAL